MHADDAVIATSLESAGSAWDMMPEGVVGTVSKEEWEISAAGGFCLRVTQELQEMEPVAPADDWLCVICFESDSAAILTSCGHTFHSRCIAQWFRCSSHCPLCRRKCRQGPAIALPPMSFELEPWPMLPESAISEDATTPSQDRVQALRQKKHLSTAAIKQRRQKLADRFRCKVPCQSFFQEIDAADDSTGAAVVLARSQQFKQEAQSKFEGLEAVGREFTVWPMNGCWYRPPIDLHVLARHSAMTTRLALRHPSLSDLSLSLQRSTTQGLAKQVLRACYRQAPARQEPCQGLARQFLDMCYKRQMSVQVGEDAKDSEMLPVGVAEVSRLDVALRATVVDSAKLHVIAKALPHNLSF